MSRFGPGEGLELDQSRCMKGAAYTIIIEVRPHPCAVDSTILTGRSHEQARLEQTTGWRRLLYSEGWGDK